MHIDSWETIGNDLERKGYKGRRSATKNRNEQAGKHPETQAVAVARTLTPHDRRTGLRDKHWIGSQMMDSLQEAWTTKDKLDGNHCARWATSTSVSTWMGDRQGRPSAVDLCPFVGVDVNLWPTTVYIAVIVLTRTWNESNQTITVVL